jgi:hypothetical protein
MGTGWRVAVAAALLAACGDRGKPDAGDPPPATPRISEGVVASVETPDSVAWGSEADVKLTVANRSASAAEGARLQVLFRAPLQPVVGAASTVSRQTGGATSPASPSTAGGAAAPASPGAQPVASTQAEGTRLTFALARLEVGREAEFVQRMRIPAATAADSAGGTFVVRAWVEAADGRSLGPATEDTLVMPRPGAPPSCGGAGEPPVTRFGVGGVRLGMKAADLRALCPGTRDTTWKEEGTAEKGISIAFGKHRLLAVLGRDSAVQRLVVRDSGLATPAGARLGSTLGDLRARYGRTCAGVGEGAVAVWFPNAPGISFQLGATTPPEWSGRQNDPALLPDTTTVTKLWVRTGQDDCPAPAGNTAGGGR